MPGVFCSVQQHAVLLTQSTKALISGYHQHDIKLFVAYLPAGGIGDNL